MKLLVVISATESKWGSCKVISPNLHKLYHGLGPDYSVEWFEIPEHLLKGELLSETSIVADLIKRIKTINPDRLIFVDHLPPPAMVLGYMSLQMDLKKLPPVIFHLYGDFTYFSKEWNLLNTIFLNHPVRFIAASTSQQKLVSAFLNDDMKELGCVDTLCFPVNSKEYFFNPDERNQLRNEMGLQENDVAILYSGRISLQKNVDLLINEFLKLKKKNINYHLWIVGPFDDIGADFLGFESYHGCMFAKIQSILDSCSADELKRIKFFGNLNKTKLRKNKAAADVFVSFSLYHDEDYGMSPAEALSTGLVSVLTDWGGYSSFASDDKWDCSLVDVSLNEFGQELNTQIFHDQVEKYISDNKKRQTRSEQFQQAFSIDGNISTLKKILNNPPVDFLGFNWLLEQHASAMNENWSKVKFNKFLAPSGSGFYFTMYKNYISKLSGLK